jgi:hypothetical protein
VNSQEKYIVELIEQLPDYIGGHNEYRNDGLIRYCLITWYEHLDKIEIRHQASWRLQEKTPEILNEIQFWLEEKILLEI